MVARRRRLEWFDMKSRDEPENIRAVVEMQMEGKRPLGRWDDTVGRDMKAWKIMEGWTTNMQMERPLEDPLL